MVFISISPDVWRLIKREKPTICMAQQLHFNFTTTDCPVGCNVQFIGLNSIKTRRAGESNVKEKKPGKQKCVDKIILG